MAAKRRIVDYRERLVLVVPAELKERVTRRAHENYCSASEWTRRVLAKAVAEIRHDQRPAAHP